MKLCLRIAGPLVALIATLTAFEGSALANPPSGSEARRAGANASEYVSDFGALHYAMAEAVGADADAAYEDAVGFATEHTYAAAMRQAWVCPETSWAEQVAGGWIAVCGTHTGEFLGYAGEYGMLIQAHFNDMSL